jgi:CheY-like chemotaxis protein
MKWNILKPILNIIFTNKIANSSELNICLTNNNVKQKDSEKEIKFFIKCIFHELRNPLNNITLGVDTLLNDEQDSDKKNTLEIIKKSCEFLNLTLNGFLLINNNNIDVTKIVLSMTPFNIIGLLHKMEYLIHFNTMEKEIKIIYNIADLICHWFMGDSSKLEQAFLNLLLNAIKHSIHSSIITIEVFNVNYEGIQINIIDQNYNIPPNVKERLFQKFVTTDGIGLGLYLTKKIIELHNGQIYHESIAPKGNRFSIILSLEQCKHSNKIVIVESNKEIKNISPHISPPISPPKSPYMSHTLSKTIRSLLHILIVDDSELTRKMLTKIIKKNITDSEIYEAHDGLESIKIIHENINNINIIFMDNIMPNITGPLATKIIRKMGYNNLIIGITGNGAKDDINNFLNDGCDYVFIKPFSNNQLVKIINFIEINGCESRENYKMIFSHDKLIWE